uniref:[histone H3]-trimethyl-L-lysine(9) demethylase n=1 Tax=Bionectria ochroleuca TaxID=29856 RepID=A0A8H7TRL2_BIOOC
MLRRSSPAMSNAAPSIESAQAAPPTVSGGALNAQPDEKLNNTKDSSQTFLHSPPDSNNTSKSDVSDSELSELDDELASLDAYKPLLSVEEPPPSIPPDADNSPGKGDDVEADIGEVLPDHWSGAVPVFKPTMHQFQDFKRFMTEVNSYGMKSGVIKIIPPKEWKDKQPPLDELVKTVRVREPIKQDIMGSNGTYRQVNILHGRSYNVPQWRQLCDQSEHQPPARRGERRANADKPRPPRRAAAPKTQVSSAPKKRGRRAGRAKGGPSEKDDEERPMTPVSPKAEPDESTEGIVASIEEALTTNAETDEPCEPQKGASRQPKTKTQSVSARRKFSKREGSAAIDEAAFKDFDYQMDISEYTPERCEELERVYWKTLTYASPLYGADMMGSLFDDRTEIWNLNKLPNLLDVLGTKIPGVNTAYLYFGMWKATFAWHLEDVDLYSINYVHFGAPKQWYSISQADARRFEAAMKNIWPADAKSCSQFLRHKGFLISPQHLLSHYGIKVNKVVSYPGEFVVTYPYGYHSGYNLGYNCAEAVNFALEPWLEMGKVAKRCECAQAQDSVWINVYEIERKLRGEETEYEETDFEDEEEDEDSRLPTPPAGHAVKVVRRKRKRDQNGKEDKSPLKKRIKLRLKSRAEPPCCLCPNDVSAMELLQTDDGRRAHRVCALYLPETYIDLVDGKEVISNVSGIHKDRTELKCLYCRSKRGACFQCSQKKCARAYHATCAAAAGVFVEEGDVPVFGEDEVEYKEQAFEFSCRFHRSKRDRKLDGSILEEDSRIRNAAQSLEKGAVCQFQYHKGDIFAGIVVENRAIDQTLLIDILPHGDQLEVEWKWLLLPDPSDYHLPKASAKAIPMPASHKAKAKLNAKRGGDEKPRKDDTFVDGCVWAEFNLHEVEKNPAQVKVDLGKPDQIWYYLARSSTDAKAQYTEDPANPRHNPKGNYLDTIPKPAKPASVRRQNYQPYVSPYSQQGGMHLANQMHANSMVVKPYIYKPRIPVNPTFHSSGSYVPPTTAAALPKERVAATMFVPYVQPQQAPHTGQGGSDWMYSKQLFAPRPSVPSTPKQLQQPQQPQQPQHPQQAPVNHGPVQYAGPSAIAKQTVNANGQDAPNRPGHPRHPSKPSWQVHSSVYQKYPFFQVHHNRDSSKYRTPYSPWGGFTNGYEGDLRAYLKQNQNELLKRASLTSTSSLHRMPSATTKADLLRYMQPASYTPAAQGAQAPIAQKVYKAGPPESITVATGYQMPSSTGQHIIPTTQPQGQNPQPMTTPPARKSKQPPAPRVYKIPAKESPVPLPPNFLAAMTSKGTSSPNSEVSAPPTPTADKGERSITVAGITPHRTVTPVPIPKFSGMTPHQAAAKAHPPTQVGGKESELSIQVQPGPSTAITPVAMRDDTQIPQQAMLTPTKGSIDEIEPDSSGEVQDFPDVPGRESMEFMERMMANLRRVVEKPGGN